MSKKDGIEKNGKVKKPIFKKWWFWLIVVIVIIGAVGGGKGKTDKADNKKDNKVETKSESKKQEVAQATPVTFEQMVTDYKANGSAADGKYKNKELQFSGKVTKITDGIISGSDITIEAGKFTDNEYMETTATVNIKDKEVAKTLVSGQEYTFTAKGTGAVVLDGGWVSNLTFKDGSIK